MRQCSLACSKYHIPVCSLVCDMWRERDREDREERTEGNTICDNAASHEVNTLYQYAAWYVERERERKRETENRKRERREKEREKERR